MSTAKNGIVSPDLGDPDQLTRFTGNTLDEGAEYCELQLVDLACRDCRAGRVRFDTALLHKVDLARSQMRDAAFNDVRITSSDLSNADWTGARASRLEVRSCRLTGLVAAEGKYEHARFRDCRADYAVFQLSKLERCWFENCSLVDATFEAGTLKHVVFKECDLTNVRFFQTRLNEVDLRGSQIEGIGIGLEDLKGLTIDLLQAPVIASLFGVTIADR